MHKKGKGVQNWSLLLKIATDITTFKDDYWFVLTGETFIKIKIKSKPKHCSLCKMPTELSLQEATKTYASDLEGAEGTFRGLWKYSVF